MLLSLSPSPIPYSKLKLAVFSKIELPLLLPKPIPPIELPV
ncbi:unnamed protein product, partial [marine sediment metagenome]